MYHEKNARFSKKYHKNRREVEKYFRKNEKSKKKYNADDKETSLEEEVKISNAKTKGKLKSNKEHREAVRNKKFTHDDRENILKKTNGRCACCGKKMTSREMTIDHLFPVSKGGDNNEYNLIPLCKKCNSDKGSLVIDFEYTRYLANEHLDNYLKHQSRLKSIYNKNKFISNDTTQYTIIPSSVAIKVLNGKSGKNFWKNYNNIMKYCSTTVDVTKAYTGDAKAIADLVSSNKFNYLAFKKENLAYYENELAVLDEMKKGEVYVCRCSDKVVGFIAFKKLNYYKELKTNQIQSLEEETGYRFNYMLTMIAIADKISASLYDTICTDILKTFIARGNFPMLINPSDYILGLLGDIELKLVNDIQQNCYTMEQAIEKLSTTSDGVIDVIIEETNKIKSMTVIMNILNKNSLKHEAEKGINRYIIRPNEQDCQLIMPSIELLARETLVMIAQKDIKDAAKLIDWASNGYEEVNSQNCEQVADNIANIIKYMYAEYDSIDVDIFTGEKIKEMVELGVCIRKGLTIENKFIC